ncbi:MAG: cysteine--tRNA ligase [Nitrososphaerales archaeon]
MKLYNTMSGRLEDLKPSDGQQQQQIRIYLCGVTVYDYSHVGHARTIIIFDVLRRYLAQKGYRVRFVQNFTDVDDKIINAAKELGVEPKQLSQRFIDQYFQDFDALNVLRADVYPRATDHIDEMQKMVQGLVEKDFAYASSKGVYFHVPSDKDYGRLSKKPLDELQAGARVEVDPEKKSPLDFALWKLYDSGPLWESSWGRGRPGWHIECSAMSIKYLGSDFEIHGGGEDLIFPHHENEIAQSESYTGTNFARHWVHVGMVTIRGEKMAKSLKNIEPIHVALKRWRGNAVRIYCLSGHYRKTLDYDEELLENALARWRDIENCAYELEFADGSGGPAEEAGKVAKESLREFLAAMDNDLDTPNALTAFTKLVKAINRYAAGDELSRDVANAVKEPFDAMTFVLGLKKSEVSAEERKEIEDMIGQRNEYREQKRYADADRIREELGKKGVELMDHKVRTVWKKLEM